MDAASPLQGTTTYSIDAKLFSDGSATGFFDCADIAESTAEGDFFGPITSWKKVGGKIALSGTAELWNLGRTVRLGPDNHYSCPKSRPPASLSPGVSVCPQRTGSGCVDVGQRYTRPAPLHDQDPIGRAVGPPSGSHPDAHAQCDCDHSGKKTNLSAQSCFGLQRPGKVAIHDSRHQADVLNRKRQIQTEAMHPVLVLERALAFVSHGIARKKM